MHWKHFSSDVTMSKVALLIFRIRLVLDHHEMTLYKLDMGTELLAEDTMLTQRCKYS